MRDCVLQHPHGSRGDRLVSIPVRELDVETAHLRVHEQLVSRIRLLEGLAHTLDFRVQFLSFDRAFVSRDLFLRPAPALGQVTFTAEVGAQRKQSAARAVDARQHFSDARVHFRRDPERQRFDRRGVHRAVGMRGRRDDQHRDETEQHGPASAPPPAHCAPRHSIARPGVRRQSEIVGSCRSDFIDLVFPARKEAPASGASSRKVSLVARCRVIPA